MPTQETDVCIVGAGFAGLTAALRLSQAGKDVVVLEARDCVGGRVHTEYLPDGAHLDFGGTWLGPGQDRAYALAAEMGATTYPTWCEGEHLMVSEDGTTHRYEGSVPLSLGIFGLTNLGLAVEELNEFARQVPLDAPWQAARAKEWDSQTIATWLNSGFNFPSTIARDVLRTIMAGIFTSDAAEVSFLHALFHLHAAGGFARQADIKGGAQQDRVNGGAQTIVNRIAERLGDRVCLGMPVREVRQRDDHVELVADALTVRARRAVLALPIPLLAQVRFDPPLPTERALLIQRLPGGWATKILVAYDEPFWRYDGLTGQTMAPYATIGLTLDGSPASGKPGMIYTFAFGSNAQKFARLSADDRRALVLKELTNRFGPQAATPTYYVEHDWAQEEWTRGCYMSHYPPGVMTSYGHVIREPVGRVHWAGAETSTIWNGGIDGAVRSGERAATEIQQADE